MKFQDIESFIGVVNHGSFTKASEHSYISQPSISKAVKRLEGELQVELFDRSTRHLRLTDAGKVVYRQGEQALTSLAKLPSMLNELKDGTAGEIKIGMPPLIGTLFFPKIARTFRERYPNVKLELVELGAQLIEQLVEKSKIDVGLIVLPVDQSLFNIDSFYSDEFVLCIHQNHQLATQESVTLAELKDEQFIVFSKGFTLHDYIINSCKEAGFVPSILYESSQWDLILELVASKMGIALLPKLIFERQNNSEVKTIPLKSPRLLWDLGIITKKGGYHSFVLRKLLQLFTN